MYINVYFYLWKINIIKTIPANAINAVELFENNEAVIDITEGKCTRVTIDCPEEERVKIRKKVLSMLLEAVQYLPDEYSFVLRYAYRSVEVQQKFWIDTNTRLSEIYPDKNIEEIKNIARTMTALPNGCGPHQTGGAIDVLLLKNGKLVDCGTEYRSRSYKIRMFCKEISDEAKNNRRLLRETLSSVGFVYYPGEWWHYCYGDRMWAVYTNRKECFYGPISYT